MKYWFVLALAVAILMYSIMYCLFAKAIENKTAITKIRKIWFSLCLLIYSLLINFGYMPAIDSKNNLPIYNGLGIIQEVWDLIIYFLVMLIFAIIIDLFIIRSILVAEINLAGVGGKFEESAESITRYENLTDQILNKINTEFKILQEIEIHLDFIQDKLDSENGIDFLSELLNLLHKYSAYLNDKVSISIIEDIDEEETLQGIKNAYHMKAYKYEEFRFNLANNASTPCLSGKDLRFYPKNILLIPYKIDLPIKEDNNPTKIIIAVEAKDTIITEEQYIICNMAKAFEQRVYIRLLEAYADFLEGEISPIEE